jgi:hypothetical protein
MKNFTTTTLAAAIILSLTACGGGETEATKEPVKEPLVVPTIEAPIDLTNIDFVGASSIFITGDVVESSSSVKKQTVSSEKSYSAIGTATRTTSNNNSDITLSPNTTYKIMSDGTLEAVPLYAGDEDVRGAVSSSFVKSIGHGWTVISIAVEQVQRVAKDTLPGSEVVYNVVADDLEYTYLVNNNTGKAFRADFLATPILDYDKGEVGVYERADDMVSDLRSKVGLSDEQKENIFKTISFDDNGDLYVLGRVADEVAYEIDTRDKTSREVFLKVNTSDTESSSLIATEIPIVFNGDVEHDSITVSDDGLYILFKDNQGTYRYTSTLTNETNTLVNPNGNGEAIDLVFTLPNSDKTYGIVNGTSGVQVYGITFSNNGVSVDLLTDTDYELDSSNSYIEAPFSDRSQTINGYTIVGDSSTFSVFDENANSFIQKVSLKPDGFVRDNAKTDRSIFVLLERTIGITEVVRWTPNPSLPNNQTISNVNIDPNIFKVLSIEIDENKYLSFKAIIINPLNGFNVGDEVLARVSLRDTSTGIEILKTISSNEPTILIMESISQGDTISVDGYNQDWAIDYRVITDLTGDATGLIGDLSFVSMVENSDKIWFLIEADTSLVDVKTSLQLSSTKQINIQNDNAYFVDGGTEYRLNDVFGIYGATEKNIELNIPKSLLTDETLTLGSTTTNIIDVQGDVFIVSDTLDNDIAELSLQLDSSIGDATVTIDLLDDVTIVITEPTSDSYDILVNDWSISTLGGSVQVSDNKITFSFSLSAIGLDSSLFEVTGAHITSEPMVTLGELIDEAS